MEFITGRLNALEPGIMNALGRYRHKVFIEKLGWNLACEHGMELDQFDHADTLYVIARNTSGDVVGSAHLLPTDRPYLLGEVFPQLMGGAAAPCDPLVWELSRFAATDFFAATGNALSQFSSTIVDDLLDAVMAEAASHGVQRLITVSPLGIERLLRRRGFEARRAAPPQIIDGKPIFACWIEVGRKAPSPTLS